MTGLLNSGKMKHINIPKWCKHKLNESKIHALCSASLFTGKNIYTSSLMHCMKVICIIRTLNIIFNKTYIF